MRFEEAVEESDIVKTETERDLFDLQVRDLELTLGIGDQRLNDDIACRTFAYRLNRRTEVRQGQTHRLGILTDMMPFVVMLEH